MIRLAWACCLVLAAPAFACPNPPWANAVPGSDVSLQPDHPGTPTRAWYADLSADYGHAVLGDALEPTTLHVWNEDSAGSCGFTASAGPGHVFEDIAPRLADVDGDGRPEVVAVRSSFRQGGQLIVYQVTDSGLSVLAQTPYIGRRNRWLAPAGVADLDGDGSIEVAYVDRPHLAKTLRIWRYRNGDFREVATVAGVSNHRIGEDYISGGLRTCRGQPEIVLASGDWQRLLALTFDGETISERDLGRWSTSAARRVLAECDG